jgi:hypothetical protein
VLTELTSAGDRELLWAVTVQVESPLLRLIVLGSQLCDRLPMPWREERDRQVEVARAADHEELDACGVIGEVVGSAGHRD